MPKELYRSFTVLIISIVLIVTMLDMFLPLPRLINLKVKKPTINLTAIDFHPNIAVIVEFRAVDQMVSIVHNVNYHIPSVWPIQIFHGKANQNFIQNSTLAPLIQSGKIILTLMYVAYGKYETNRLLTDAKFWKRVRGEKILFFQIDSVMCSNSPHKVSDFLQYDYVGAPWDLSWFSFSKVDLVGNGGFSLRSRSKLLDLLDLVPYKPRMPEDVWYSQNLRRVNGSVAPVNVAKTFAVESIYYERPLGVHRFHLSCRVQKKLFKTCPESQMIMSRTCP